MIEQSGGGSRTTQLLKSITLYCKYFPLPLEMRVHKYVWVKCVKTTYERESLKSFYIRHRLFDIVFYAYSVWLRPDINLQK
jgi:hypothetical protein